jgi:hypothetical protein
MSKMKLLVRIVSNEMFFDKLSITAYFTNTYISGAYSVKKMQNTKIAEIKIKKTNLILFIKFKRLFRK